MCRDRQLGLPGDGVYLHGNCLFGDRRGGGWRRKGVRRSNLKIIASDPDPAAITRAVEALN
jgi:hypothetical protein